MDTAQTAEFQTTTDIDVLKKMEDEHQRLQRQVRMIQVDRQQRNMGVHPQFRRQDELMRTLKMEYINLCKDLKIARSGAHKKKDKKMKLELRNSLLYRVETQMECEADLTIMDQINSLIQKNHKETLNLRKLTSATQGQLEERRNQSEHRLASAENKLETATLRFNVVQCENNKIREEIDHMLQDRACFNQAWVKMLSALSKGKKFLNDLFESSTLAYDQRDEWCTKLKSMHEKGKIDQMLQVQEMRDLVKAYDHEMKIYLFLATKGMTRVNRKQERREEAEKRRDEEFSKRQYQYHVKLLDDISDYTGENSTMRIIDVFLKKEQENFSLYQLLTDFCAENDVLRRSLKAIRQEIDDRRDFNELMDNKRDTMLENLRELVEVQKVRTEAMRRKNDEKNQLINDVMNKINDMFTMLDCSLEPFQNLLGDKQPSVRQISLTLRLITDKIKEYKENVYYYELDGRSPPLPDDLCEEALKQTQRIMVSFKVSFKDVHWPAHQVTTKCQILEHCVKKSEKASTSRLKKYTVQAEPPEYFKPTPINLLVPADPCPSCVETRWLSRISDGPESPFDMNMALNALKELSSDPAYVRSDRVHTIIECIVPRSRALLARRYLNH